MSQTLAHYRITEKIGQGGMGEVYRATDTKLNREVAIKLLPAGLATDPERMTRFAREAQVLAALNHPNIASIYGLEEAGSQHGLVMELVEGPTLDARLRRGPMPIEETLDVARQIAEALEEAHERGVVHRDLKPANVKITPAGVVKLLDFGLAKALDSSPQVPSTDASLSPTINALTQVGVIMGTAAYMSPEQARGQKVDRRSDIWAFGVVLYEMLTGRAAFEGETSTDLLASVLKTDIDFAAVPAATPAAVVELLRRCLVKEPRHRLQSIGDARIVLAEHQSAPHAMLPSTPLASLTPPSSIGRREHVASPLWRRALPWALAVLAIGAAAGLAVRPGPPAEAPLRVSVALPGEMTLRSGIGTNLALSPDGRQLVYTVGNDSQSEVRLRSLGQLVSSVLVSGVGQGRVPYHPFFSPDGQWVGYVTAAEMFKVPVTGGTPQSLTPLARSRGATWAEDGTIVFARSPNSGLFRLSAAGGEPQPLTTLDAAKKEATHRWPHFLPGGRALLFTSHTQVTGKYEAATIEALVLATGERKVVHRGGSDARYLDSGHIVFAQRGTLFAAPFDAGTLSLTGSPAPVVNGVAWDPNEGGAEASVSTGGRLAYAVGENQVPRYPVSLASLDGSTTTLVAEEGTYANPRVSPDGRQLALTVLRDDNWDIWVYDLLRGVSTRLTFDAAVETEQVWTPDGKHLIFSSDVGGVDNLYRKRADGSGAVERLTESRGAQWAHAITPDGRFAAVIGGVGNNDVWIVPLEGARTAEPFVKTSPFNEGSVTFSPDGRWVAHESNESGREEIYVRPFPARPGKWQISDGGGAYPRFSRDGRRLYYRTNEGIMAADVRGDGDTFVAEKPRLVLRGRFRGGLSGLTVAGFVFSDYDVTPDGRFVVFPAPPRDDRAEQPHVVLVTGWFDELRRVLGR